MKAVPQKNNGIDGWAVEFPRINGKRNRPWWKEEKNAIKAIKDYQAAVKKAGDFWVRLGDDARRKIEVVYTACVAARHDLLEVWQGFLDSKKKKEEQAAEIKTPMAYEDAVTEWKSRKLGAGQTEKYVHYAAQDLMLFGAGRERRNIHEILPDELEEYIKNATIRKPGKLFGKPWGLSTKRTNMALFSSLWEVALAKGWATLNIVDRLEPIGKIGRIVKIYPNETTENLMAAAMSTEETQRIVGEMACGFFGCMRPDEVSSKRARRKKLPREKWFGWHDIDLEHGLVTVRVEIAKTGDQRVIRLQPTALKWLKVAKDLGCTFPAVNSQKLHVYVWRLCGLEEKDRDGMRKNCATHLRPIYKNDYDVIKDMGNSVRILLKHYADLHTPEPVSIEHWMITPGKVELRLKSKEWPKFLKEKSANLPSISAVLAGRSAGQSAKDEDSE